MCVSNLKSTYNKSSFIFRFSHTIDKSCKISVSDMSPPSKFMQLGYKRICIQWYCSGYDQTYYSRYPAQGNHNGPRISQYIGTIDTGGEDKTNLKPWICEFQYRKSNDLKVTITQKYNWVPRNETPFIKNPFSSLKKL